LSTTQAGRTSSDSPAGAAIPAANPVSGASPDSRWGLPRLSTTSGAFGEPVVIQAVASAEARLVQNVTLEYLFHLCAIKTVCQRQGVEIRRVQAEVITMQAFVVPRRAGAVVTVVVAGHVGVAAHESREPVQAFA